MKLYKGTHCSLFLAGTLEEEPIIYEIENKCAAEFFMTVYKADTGLDNTNQEDQFFLYRVFAKNSQAVKVKHHARLGIQLFIEGELQNYHVMFSDEKNLVVAEVKAKKLWFGDSSGLNQLGEKHDDSPANFYSKNIIDAGRSQYLH